MVFCGLCDCFAESAVDEKPQPAKPPQRYPPSSAPVKPQSYSSRDPARPAHRDPALSKRQPNHVLSPSHHNHPKSTSAHHNRPAPHSDKAPHSYAAPPSSVQHQSAYYADRNNTPFSNRAAAEPPFHHRHAPEGVPGIHSPPSVNGSHRGWPAAEPHKDPSGRHMGQPYVHHASVRALSEQSSVRDMRISDQSRLSSVMGSDRVASCNGADALTVHDVATIVESVLLGRLSGRFHRQYTIQPGSVRRLVHCVACRAVTSFGRDVDVLFFAREEHWRRQQDSTKKGLQVYRPLPREVQPAHGYTDQPTGTMVALPPYIISDATKSLDDVLLPLDERQRNLVLSAMCEEVVEQIGVLHKLGYVHTQIDRSNIVCFYSSDVPRWTLLEFCTWMRAGKTSTTLARNLNPRYTAPEVAPRLLYGEDGGAIVASAAMDIWQLGVLFYEVYRNRAYWSPSHSNESVLEVLCSRLPLPHHEMPGVGPDLKRLLTVMLERNPAERVSVQEVDMHLKRTSGDHTVTYTALTGNNQTIVMPSH